MGAAAGSPEATGAVSAPDTAGGLAASIIIPAYNAARYIEGALASACAQTERRIEVLVVDDCSTDQTAALVRAAAERDGRVRLLRTVRNGGPAVARNLGLASARGAWIAILDADDCYEPRRLERLIALAEAQGADMCADNLLNVYESGECEPEPMLTTEQLPQPRRLSLTAFLEGNLVRSERRVSFGFLQPMVRRAFLESHGLRYDETLRFSEDYTFYVACLKAGASWWVTPEPMYRYLIREGSLTEVQTAKDLDRLRQLDRQLLADPVIVADPRLARVVGRHREDLDRRFYYRAFTDALKSRQWGGAARLSVHSSSAARLIALESLRQAPAILRKALRGGYRESRAKVPAEGSA